VTIKELGRWSQRVLETSEGKKGDLTKEYLRKILKASETTLLEGKKLSEGLLP